MKLLFRWLCSFAVLSLACKQVDSVADILLVASVEVTPATATLSPQETVQLVAVPRTEGGLELPARDVSWASSDPSKVSVSPEGEVRALAPGGPFTITASIEGVDGAAQITVLAVAAQVTVSRQPSGTVPSGLLFPIQPAVLVKDTQGSPVAGVVVTVSIASGGGTLSGPLTAVSAANGTATFSNLSITGLVGARKLSFSAPGAPSVNSNNINVTAGPASQLTITTQPGSPALADAKFSPQPVIQLRDAAGNPVNQSGVAVTASLNPSSGDGVLGGGLTVNTNGSGAATFSGLKISKAGSYTLKFTATGLTPVTSSIISVF